LEAEPSEEKKAFEDEKETEAKEPEEQTVIETKETVEETVEMESEETVEMESEEKEIVPEEETVEPLEEEEIQELIEEERKPKFEEEELEEIVEERIYTIPLGRAWLVQPRRRAPKAIRIIKSFIQRHMKVGTRPEAGEEDFLEEEAEKPRVIVSNELNELIWRRGAEKPPRKVRVRAAKDKEGYVTVYPA